MNFGDIKKCQTNIVNARIYEDLLCAAKTVPSHLLRSPRRLQCGHMCCLLCFEKQVANPQPMRFPCCAETHNLRQGVLRDMLVEYKIDDNLVELSTHLSTMLAQKTRIMTEVTQRDKTIQNMFDFIAENIDIRFESLEIELSKLQENLLNAVDTLHVKMKCKLKQRTSKLLLQIDNKTHNRSQVDIWIKTDRSLLALLRHKKFFNVNKTLVIDFGRLEGLSLCGIIDIDDMARKFSPQFVRLPFNGFDVCEYIDGLLLVTDTKANCLHVLDRTHRPIRTINQIDGVKLTTPKNIFMHATSQQVFLLTDKVLCFPVTLDKVKHINVTVLKPRSICIDANSLYISDALYNIFLYDISQLELHDAKLLSQITPIVTAPSSSRFSQMIYVCNSLLVTSRNTHILNVQNLLDGAQTSIDIEHDRDAVIHSFVVTSDRCIFLHIEVGGLEDRLMTFRKSKEKDEWCVVLDRPFSLSDAIRLIGSWSLKIAHGRLVLVAWSQFLVII